MDDRQLRRRETVAEIASPDGTLAVSVTLDPDGRPGYAISRRGAAVIAESRLGFILANAPKLERGFRIAGTERRSTDETWEQPWGERRFVRDRCNELASDWSKSRRSGAAWTSSTVPTTMASAFATNSLSRRSR